MLYFHLVLMAVFLALSISHRRICNQWRESIRLGWVNTDFAKDKLDENKRSVARNLVFAVGMALLAYLEWTRI